MIKKHSKLKLVLLITSVLALMVLIFFLVGRSFGFFQYAKKGEVVNVITINGLVIQVDNTTDEALNLLNTYPVYDSTGLKNDPFVFTITNTSKKAIDYTLKLLNDEEKQDTCFIDQSKTTPCTLLPYQYIKYAYSINDSEYSTPTTLTQEGIIYSETINGKEARKISIKLWIDSEAPNSIQGNAFFGKLILTGEKALKPRCDIALNTVYDFPFDSDGDGYGQEQTFTVPCDGTYKLEVWGAQGGSVNTTYVGGYGGYSEGVLLLNRNDSLKVVVGGAGTTTSTAGSTAEGGYNGGGAAKGHGNKTVGSGGGATHIAKANEVYTTLESYTDSLTASSYVYIVAGGGGGSSYEGAQYTANGGSGGGATGGNSTHTYSDRESGYGGTQTSSTASPYTGYYTNAGFGIGSSSVSDGVGAGSGWYGGSVENGATGGGGGSGYLNSSLANAQMYCYTGCSGDNTTVTSLYGEHISEQPNVGNGYARITYLGNN